MGKKFPIFPFVWVATIASLWIGGTRIARSQTPLPAPNLAPGIVLNQRAMTVIGQGIAAAPADTATLEFRYSSRTPLSPPPMATPTTPTPGVEGNLPSPVELALKPVVDALITIKVPEKNIKLQTSDPDNPKVVVILDNKPTRDRISEVVKTATSAIQNSSTLFPQGVGAVYAVNDCLALERTARRAALRDALTQASTIASDLGVKTGEVLLVTVFPSFGSPASVGCGTKVGVPISPFAALSETTPPYNPSADPEVEVRVQLSVTYAIANSK